MWSSILFEEENNSPCNRCKHSVSLLGDYLYLLAGRNGNVPLKDFWRYHLVTRKWELLKPTGDPLPSLQEHTAVIFRENIYVFGGELGFSGGNETPLWIYESEKNVWRKSKGQRGANVPKGRRGHTALVHRESAFMYGGYCDLRGSSNELWIFHFGTESWHLLWNEKTDPPGRHKHSAIIHDENMWIYGGMTDLQERSDLWRFDIATKKWYLIKCKINPGPLHSHIACKLPNSMIIFGGERNGQLVNELWRFYFGIETWQFIQMDVICPQPISESCAVAISELLLEDGNVMNENCSPVNLCELLPSHDVSNRYSSVENCKPINAECLSSRSTNSSVLPSRQGVMPPRRQGIAPNSFFKEISKISQMNISKLAQNSRCSYQRLLSSESASSVEETVNEKLSRASNVDLTHEKSSPDSSVPREVPYLENSILIPSNTVKLVYLEDEESPVFGEKFPVIHRKLDSIHNKNRISYPFTNSVRFSNPLVTPEETFSEITSDYASCENIHKLLSPDYHSSCNGIDEVKVRSKDTVTSFSNPNYLTKVDEKIVRGDCIKLNSPADSVFEDSGWVEMTEFSSKPVESPPSSNDDLENELEKCEKDICERYDHRFVSSICILLVGGKQQRQITSFKQPISLWKLSLAKEF